ncbi:MAG: rRNA maturation RNase YbeY [Bdellovibrionaceae bacterium]|nr:rRNA maturation RNase YbeY [Pseudobdellovibrionaceae bacterium]
MSLQLQILNSSKSRTPRAFLGRWVKACERELARGLPAKARARLQGDLTLVFLSRREARKINKQYRGRDYATDVLSFESEGGFGDLVLCPEVLKKQAAEHGLSYQQELGYMVLHGILHLLGYDHELGEREARQMFQLQDRVFETLLGRLKSR